MQRVIYASITIFVFLVTIVLYPNSRMVNLVLGYQLEELQGQKLYKSFERRDELLFSSLYLLKNGRYEERLHTKYGCVSESDMLKGPWIEMGRYEIEEGIIYLYPGILKEQMIYNSESHQEEYKRKFSFSVNWPRKLLILDEYNSLVEQKVNYIYTLNEDYDCYD